MTWYRHRTTGKAHLFGTIAKRSCCMTTEFREMGHFVGENLPCNPCALCARRWRAIQAIVAGQEAMLQRLEGLVG